MTPAPRLTLAREPELDGATEATFTPRPDELPLNPSSLDVLCIAELRRQHPNYADRLADEIGRRFDAQHISRNGDTP